jgi:hypothetical protein
MAQMHSNTAVAHCYLRCLDRQSFRRPANGPQLFLTAASRAVPRTYH